MARLLILRDRAAAGATMEAVRRHGHDPVLLPLQEIVPLDPAVPEMHLAGFILTSANAVPWLSRRFAADPRPVLAVGKRTGAALRAAGFADVREGEGDAVSLLPMAHDVAAGGTLLYAAGRVREPAFETALRERGVSSHAVEVYDALIRLPPRVEAEKVLGDERIDAVLLLSVQQANGFAALTEAYPGLFEPAPRLLCLSKRIAAALAPERRSGAFVAPMPELSALLARYRPDAVS